MKREIGSIAQSAAIREARRPVAAEPNRIPASTIEIDVIDKLNLVYYVYERVAKTFAHSDANGDGESLRLFEAPDKRRHRTVTRCQ
jgi:hypothetical protein